MLLELRKGRKCIRGSDSLQIYGHEDRFRHQAFLVSICPGSERNEKKDGEVELLRDELARETRRRKEGEGVRGSDRFVQTYGHEDRFRHQAFLVSICPGSEGKREERRRGQAATRRAREGNKAPQGGGDRDSKAAACV